MAEPIRLSTFVTVVAWLTLIVSGFQGVMGLLGVLFLLFVMGTPDTALTAQDAGDMPALIRFALNHMPAVMTPLVVVWGLVFACALGLLRRREWARRTFIGLLLLGVLNMLAMGAFQQIYIGQLLAGPSEGALGSSRWSAHRHAAVQRALRSWVRGRLRVVGRSVQVGVGASGVPVMLFLVGSFLLAQVAPKPPLPRAAVVIPIQQCPVLGLARVGGLGTESKSGIVVAVWGSGVLLRAQRPDHPSGPHVVGRLAAPDLAAILKAADNSPLWTMRSRGVAVDLPEDWLVMDRRQARVGWAETPGVTSTKELDELRRMLFQVALQQPKRVTTRIDEEWSCPPVRWAR